MYWCMRYRLTGLVVFELNLGLLNKVRFTLAQLEGHFAAVAGDLLGRNAIDVL